ncbi:MAG TPA: SDR family oxidoreductase [Vicinamibacteria bacterium]|nr:SDR family oxidoreductase [Vicinamibacteria bacterium]
MAAAPAPAALDLSPSRYIARVNRRTGKEVPGPIAPDELLVHAHRDRHPADVLVQFLGSRLLQLTGQEGLVATALRGVNSLGAGAAAMAGGLAGSQAVEKVTKRLLGVVDRDHYFKFREFTHLPDKEVKARVEKLQKEARAALAARGRRPRLKVLLTGATGFLGREILSQAAEDRRIEEIVAVVRPETVRDHRTREVLRVIAPAQRGALLLRRLHITGARARKFRFVPGDIEKPGLGLEAGELARLRAGLTHVVHCAASVSFDDTYENSYRANVLGCRNALAFSLATQLTPGSPFVSHVAIETSYIHGRRRRSIAQENALLFPRRYYNNFYELTKAMASIETDRYLIEEGLRVTQLLPSIVIGDSRTGNNRGDTKVVNAPINAFGRAKEAADRAEGDLATRLRARLVALIAFGFPGDDTAELNLVPVDRVVAGILAALTVPAAIGNRIHLATDNRIRSDDMVRICREELGANVRLSDPTLYRNVTLPLVKATLNRLNEPKLANALEKLGTIFGAYGEWGQPIHGVGNDVRILGLPIRRPDTEHAFRMLCRHNRFVQEFGRVRDPDETARRERAWEAAVDAIELGTGHQVGALPAGEFRRLIAEEIDLRAFRLRSRAESPADALA